MGAYTSGLLVTRFQIPPVVGFIASAALGGVRAYVRSAPIVRLRGYYLAVATLALCQIFNVLVIENFNITGGPTGVYGIPPFSLFGFEFTTPRSYHYLVWAIAALCLIFVRNLMKSRIGRALKAIQSSEDGALVLGVDATGMKTKMFVLTRVTGAMARNLFAHYVY